MPVWPLADHRAATESVGWNRGTRRGRTVGVQLGMLWNVSGP